jgi:hypothetical protein
MQGGIKRVWILGAGFSQPLGGPLLADLFKQSPMGSLEALYPSQAYPGLAETTFGTQILYNYGYREHHWANAEAFTAAVDLASRPGNERLKNSLDAACHAAYFHDGLRGRNIYFRERPPHVFTSLDRVVRRALALECSKFLLWAHRELLEPYRHWVESMAPGQDTVLTFNYDRVLETVAGDRLHIVLPAEAPAENRIPVFKLHGSVDWVLGEAVTVERIEPIEALNTDRKLAMGVPGEAKMTSNENEFSPLWKRAMEALQDAHEICVVGYSFPPSDAYSAHRILKGIRENTRSKIRIDIVLGGPGVGDGPGLRASRLLQSARGTRFVNDQPQAESNGYPKHFHVVHQPFFAQDFLPNYGFILDEERWPD